MVDRPSILLERFSVITEGFMLFRAAVTTLDGDGAGPLRPIQRGPLQLREGWSPLQIECRRRVSIHLQQGWATACAKSRLLGGTRNCDALPNVVCLPLDQLLAIAPCRRCRSRKPSPNAPDGRRWSVGSLQL